MSDNIYSNKSSDLAEYYQIKRVIATHNLSFLSETDLIIVLKEGEIAAQGTYQELKNNSVVSDLLFQKEFQEECQNVGKSTEIMKQEAKKDVNSETITKPKNAKANKEEEHFEVGTVSHKDYFHYFSSMGWVVFIIAAVFMTCGNASSVGAYSWITKWIELDTEDKMNKGLLVYGGLIVVEGTMLFLSCLLFYFGAIRASRSYHESLLNSIMRTPLGFFDVTPIGRVLNRFSRDISTTDREVPTNLLFIFLHGKKDFLFNY